MTWINEHDVMIRDSPNLDAFSRLRISNPVALWSTQSQYTANDLKMESGATGTGVVPSHSANARMILLSCTAGTGTSFHQSFRYIPYQPAKSQLVAITGVFGAPTNGAVKDFGYFDSLNGVFYRQNGTGGVQLVLRSSTSGSVVNTVVSQTEWNLDKLDGTGDSGEILNSELDFILIIDLQYLGMGRARVGFDIGGKIIYVHQFLCANSLSVPYMQSATLPIQILLTTTNTTSTASMYFKCAAVISEGGYDGLQGYEFSTPEGTVTAASGARTHLLSIRPKTTFNSITNRILFELVSVNISVTGINPVFWELCIGSTFSVAPTWADVNANYSGFEYGTGGTFSALTGGLVLASGYLAATATAKSSTNEKILPLYDISLSRAGAVRDMGTLTLLVTGIGGSSASRATINFLESR